jgi:hypothetical protein
MPCFSERSIPVLSSILVPMQCFVHSCMPFTGRALVWCDGPPPAALWGPRCGELYARTTPCRVKPRHPGSGPMADAPCGELNARTPPRLPLWGAELESAPGKNPAVTPVASGQEQCSGWGWQQPGAARGRQFLGPACHAAFLLAKQHYTGTCTCSRPLGTASTRLLSQVGVLPLPDLGVHVAVLIPPTVFFDTNPPTINGVYPHHHQLGSGAAYSRTRVQVDESVLISGSEALHKRWTPPCVTACYICATGAEHRLSQLQLAVHSLCLLRIRSRRDHRMHESTSLAEI